MKIVIMTDMEGVAGILNHDDWVMPEGMFYLQGRRLLTEEINAAVRGFFDGGAQEVLVIDGHGKGGIDPECLDERALLSRGRMEPVWPRGLDDALDGLAFVGQHAKAGTPYSHITHTGWFNAVDVTINGISIGEYGQMALCAMEAGVPTIFASGEKALATEAENLTPGVVTVSVKEGLLPDGLEELDTDAYRAAKLSAVHVSPKKARKLIYRGAFAAMLKLVESPRSFGYPKMKPPYTRVARFRKQDDRLPYTVKNEHATSIAELLNQPCAPVEGA